MDRSQGMIMNKYIAVAFAFMGVWFYELSGGSDFEPGEHSLVIFATPKLTEPQQPQGIGLVARAETTVPLTEVLPARAPVPKEHRPSITSEVTEGLSLVKLTTPAPEPSPELEVEPETPEVIEIVPEPEPQTPAPDLRFVDGDRVNMRGGPGRITLLWASWCATIWSKCSRTKATAGCICVISQQARRAGWPIGS